MITNAQRSAFAAARVARLATIDDELRPNLVPICFALDGDRIVSAVDAKPKRSRELKRLANVRRRPSVSVLVDHFEEDWSQLWWIVAEGSAEVIDDETAAAIIIDLLVDKYSQYQRARPSGPAIAVTVDKWRSWSAKPA